MKLDPSSSVSSRWLKACRSERQTYQIARKLLDGQPAVIAGKRIEPMNFAHEAAAILNSVDADAELT